MAWLRAGTVTTVNGSTAVVGVQTLWVTQAKSGDLFTLDGDRFYEIDTITDDTHLTLKTPFLGVGGAAQSYAIVRNFTSTLPAQLAQQLAQLMTDYHVTLDELTAWLSGVGTVTVHDGAGNAYQVKTPAQLNSEANGLLTKNVAGNANVTLSATEAGNAILDFTGTLTGNINVIVPAASHRWVVRNRTTGNFTLTVKTQNGAGVLIKQGLRDLIWCDGTDVIRGTNGADLSGADFTGPISAAALDNTPIGQTTAASGKFTTLTTTGNAGVGVTPSSGWNTGFPMIQLQKTILHADVNSAYLQTNATYNSGIKYIAAQKALRYYQDSANGVHSWSVAATGTAGGALTFTEAMQLDSGSNITQAASTVNMGTSTAPVFRQSSFSTLDQGRLLLNHTGSGYAAIGTNANGCLWFGTATNGDGTGVSKQVTLDTSGNLLVGVTSGGTHAIAKNVSEGSSVLDIYGTSNIGTAFFYGVASGGESATATAIRVRKNGTTSRSINAGGTINASGADYAEYMRKTESCGQITKGAIVGVNSAGELTDKWADAISFVVKSTDPSYVGGDTWGSEEVLGMARPAEPQFNPPTYNGAADPGDAPVPPPEPEAGASDDQLSAYLEALELYQQAAADYERVKSNFAQDQAAYAAKVEIAKQIFDTATYPTYKKELATFEAALESARQKVDRIAYAGQVPVNVVDATPGQYVVPVPDGEGIGAILVDEDDMTLKQYMKAVGVVQNILEDGRANVRVKVA